MIFSTYFFHLPFCIHTLRFHSYPKITFSCLRNVRENMNHEDNHSLYQMFDFDMLSIMILYLLRNDNWPSLQESKIIVNLKASSIEKVILIKYFEWILRKSP